MVTADDVRTFSGSGGAALSDEKILDHVESATAMVKAYTRGRGFTEGGEPADDLARVIIAFAARSCDNPVGDRQQSVGQFSRSPAVVAWSLPEMTVLNSYRRKAW